MLRPDPLRKAGAWSAESLGLPPLPRVAATPAGAQGGSFSPLAAEVRREVHAFIENGSSLASMSATPQARWLAAQAALAVQEGQGGGRLPGAIEKTPEADAADEVGALPSEAVGTSSLDAVKREFLARIEPWAKRAAAALGVAPEVVQAHAALESGWGRRPLTTAQGADSHNLFSLKATPSWRGEVVNALTTEFEEGSAVKRTEAFRRYDSLGEAFTDYVRLLSGNARYRAALHTGNNAAAFAQALARGGYATDPAYATKLTRLAEQIASARQKG